LIYLLHLLSLLPGGVVETSFASRVPRMYCQTGFCGVLGFLGPRRINNLPVFRA